ncbi:hypothetical protein ACFL1B_00230 [Nanoarchaeota archaeon]
MDNSGRSDSITLILFVAAITAILLPAAILVAGDGSDTFIATMEVQSIAPTVAVATGQSITGTTATTVARIVQFSATDGNGHGDLNDGSAYINISAAGIFLNTSGCSEDIELDINTMRYNCTINLRYWDDDTTWTISASIQDSVPTVATNDTTTLTVGTIDAISMVKSSIAWAASSPGTSDLASTSNAQQVNNTGNQDYTTINLTAVDLNNSGGIFFGVGNISVNISDQAVGQILLNNTDVQVDASSVTRGRNSFEEWYFYMDIPASTLPGVYTSAADWTVLAEN